EKFYPVGVIRAPEAYPSTENAYSAEKAFDNNPETYCCLLDTSRTGNHGNSTIPPNGTTPVEGELVLDLGKTIAVSGLIMKSRNAAGSYLPKQIDVFAYRGNTVDENQIVWLLRNVSIPNHQNGQSVAVVWKEVQAQFIGIRVLESYESGPKHFNFQIAELSFFNGQPPEEILVTIFNPPDMALTEQRLHRDWMYQDHGLKLDGCFTSTENATAETTMLQKVLAELENGGVDILALREELQKLLSVTGSDPRWKELYLKACRLRRQLRLASLAQKTPKIVYTKHCVLSGPVHYSWTDELTDQQYTERIRDFRPGAKLCMLTVQPDGSVNNEILLEKSNGMIRDPNISYDGTKIIFSMRNNYETDDFHLYTMDLTNHREIKQITFGNGCSDVEPCFLPNDDIVFQSTRCTQLTDCWRQAVSNLYLCNSEGRFLRRIGFDQVHTNYPQVLDNGTVIYTRWEYNDRTQIFPQPLFMMNPDGTGQTEYYGGNSWFPTSILHARGIPGTNKVIGIASGHHVNQHGKLIMVDRSRGTQGNAGIDFLAPVQKAAVPEITQYQEKMDRFGLTGEQFQYPYALDEEHYLVTYSPEGYSWKQGGDIYNPPFGIYWMSADGRRELLAYDPTISCNQSVPLIARLKPTLKPSQVDLAQTTGKYYVQDVYYGPGLAGIERGLVKKLRVVGLEFRAADVMYNSNTGEGGQSHSRTPISINNGSWDVKHILGEINVEEDGSAYFEVPARTPVYFQLLDEKGYVIQTMRSWSTLQPGETFACIGCHEDKTVTAPSQLTTAMRKQPQKLLPHIDAYGSLDSVASYLGVNRPKGFVTQTHEQSDGFSYPQQIQPIWDQHCLSCHNGKNENKNTNTNENKQSSFDLSGTILPFDWKRAPNNGDATQNALRDFSASYLYLTNFGHGSPLVNWISAQSRPTMLPPYSYGAAKSNLMNFLEPSHYNVTLTSEEKRLIACWIDLCVPFCGSYTEANQWSDLQKATYAYYENKRATLAEIELENLRELHRTTIEPNRYFLKPFQTINYFGRDERDLFIKRWLQSSVIQ
ncbi:MAG: hypothetical protein LBC02_06095, partial [Planctomycetaceae bacterium]|nr:hypothetical protein [Planctomycetaceae bacterium]